MPEHGGVLPVVGAHIEYAVDAVGGKQSLKMLLFPQGVEFPVVHELQMPQVPGRKPLEKQRATPKCFREPRLHVSGQHPNIFLRYPD